MEDVNAIKKTEIHHVFIVTRGGGKVCQFGVILCVFFIWKHEVIRFKSTVIHYKFKKNKNFQEFSFYPHVSQVFSFDGIRWIWNRITLHVPQ